MRLEEHMMADKSDDDGQTDLLTKTKPKTKRPPLYKVLLLNDDFTPMEFVVHVLERFFGLNHAQAFEIMLTVHKKGLAVVGVFSHEIAETKVAQVMDFARRHQHPLQCTMEKEEQRVIDARLDLALQGGLDLPEQGLIAVFHPNAEARLPGLDPDRCHIVQDFKPLYDSWEARGYKAIHMIGDRYAAAIVCLPRAKAEARALIARACEACDGIVVIDGQKTDGIDSIFREMKKRVTVNGPISKAHGKLFWIDPAAKDFFADWLQLPAQTAEGFWTAPGVFSADGVDLASALLVDALPEKLGAEVADLGAGWGFLAAHVLTRESVQTVHLVEAGHSALECARHNVTDERAKFHWEDATKWAPPHRMDTIVMNPPFHQGRAAEPQIGQAFVAAASRLLQPNGNLWMVANRHLPYEAELKKNFAHVDELGGDARFKLFHAAKPTRQRR